MNFTLHPQLEEDCYLLGKMQQCLLLLHKNSLVPWFIIVPETDQPETFKLPADMQVTMHKHTALIAQFVESHFSTDKLNIATLGNVVNQLHIHIVGRFKDDYCWPSPVWGQQQFRAYNAHNLQTIKLAIARLNIYSE